MNTNSQADAATSTPATGLLGGAGPAVDPAGEQVYLTVPEAAAFLRVNPKTLYSAIKAREVPGVVRLGRIIRIGRGALLSWSTGDTRPAQLGVVR